MHRVRESSTQDIFHYKYVYLGIKKMESDRRTDKNLRALAFSWTLRYATKFWIQDSILPECLPGAMPAKTVFLTTTHKQLKCSLIYAPFYDGHCQIPFQMHRLTWLKSKTMELKAFARYICGWC